MNSQLALKNYVVAALIAAAICHAPSAALAQGTAFSYQGRLNNGANPANGSYDLRFALYDAASAGLAQGNLLTNAATAVSNGLFAVTLDFGNQFPGANRWLEIAVRTNGGGAFSTLTPRQPLTTTPYAVTAGNISGVLAAAQLPASVVTNGAAISGTFTGNGANVTNVNAATLGGVSSAGFWKTNGNSSANPTNGAFLGTTDNLPLEFKVNGQRALRFEPNTNSPNILGGYFGNIISNGVVGGFIGGGGNAAFSNLVSGNYASVVGGVNNIASGLYSTAMGGGSTASGNYSTAGGASTAGGEFATAFGYLNIASGYASTAMGFGAGATGDYSTALGVAQASGAYSTAMGTGTKASGDFSTAMGFFNVASSNYSTAIGYQTIASGNFSTTMGFSTVAAGSAAMAAGSLAKATNDNTFVWSDGTSGVFGTTAANQFLIHAAGGVGINNNNPNGAALAVTGKISANSSATEGFEVTGPAAGYALLDRTTGAAGRWVMFATSGTLGFFSGGTTRMSVSAGGTVTATAFNPPSDRNLKENFVPVSPREVLEKVAGLPISRWNFKEDKATPHVGPMAQDFHAAFGLGTDDRHIATVDADGIALAAIQGLNEKLEARSKKLEAENAALKTRLEKLEALLEQRL